MVIIETIPHPGKAFSGTKSAEVMARYLPRTVVIWPERNAIARVEGWANPPGMPINALKVGNVVSLDTSAPLSKDVWPIGDGQNPNGVRILNAEERAMIFADSTIYYYLNLA